MKNRPKEFFIRKIRKEEPLDSERSRLVVRYRKGGLKAFEPDIAPKMVDVSLEQAGTTDPLQHDVRKWIYVGEQWWCRRRVKKKKVYYEFARMVAIRNDETCSEIEGLWDSRRHTTKQPPETVYKKGLFISGRIIGYNEWEITVCWDTPGSVCASVSPVRNINEIEFEYEEDFEKYSKIFKNIETRRRERV